MTKLTIIVLVVGILAVGYVLNLNDAPNNGHDPCPDPDRPSLAADGTCVPKAYEGIEPSNYNQVR